MEQTKWMRITIIADRFALPFWIILISYGIYEMSKGNSSGLIPLIIGTMALIVDTTLVIKNRNIK